MKHIKLTSSSSSYTVYNTVTSIENRRIHGSKYHYEYYRNLESAYCRHFKDSSVFHHYHTPDRRVTKVATHPNKPLAISGTKGGSMTLSDLSGNASIRDLYQWEGKGPGNSILDCKFPLHIDNAMLTASLDGTVKLWKLDRLSDKPVCTILYTNDYTKWFCSVAPSPDTGLTLAGASHGSVTLLDKDFKVISTLKAHKKKVNSIDFSKSCGNLFSTASLDSTVKLFDIRKLDTVLETFLHMKPVNSAVFSRMNGRRLLTTDQHSEIRIYHGPIWNLERTVTHPHRQFQHLTPIRASWHPCFDLIVIGRYPDQNLKDFTHSELKTIDIFSADSGDQKGELLHPLLKPIITSIAEFSYDGDVLVTGTGSLVLFWLIRKVTDASSNEEGMAEKYKSEDATTQIVLKRKKIDAKKKKT